MVTVWWAADGATGGVEGNCERSREGVEGGPAATSVGAASVGSESAVGTALAYAGSSAVLKRQG